MVEEVVDFTIRNRRMLAELEEAHTRSVYGALEYSECQARAIVKLVKSIIEFMKNIWREPRKMTGEIFPL